MNFKTLIANPVVDFGIFCVLFIGFGLLASVVPFLKWLYVGFNVLIGLAIAGGVIIAVYNMIKNYIASKAVQVPPLAVVNPTTPVAEPTTPTTPVS